MWGRDKLMLHGVKMARMWKERLNSRYLFSAYV